MVPCGLDVGERSRSLNRHFVVCERSELTSWRPRNERPGRDPRPGRHHGPRGDQRILADLRPVEHDGADPDQGAGAHVAAVYHGAVTDGDLITEMSGILSRRYVQGREILDIRPLTDSNSLDVPAQHGPEEHARVGTDSHVAHDDCTRCDPYALVQIGLRVSKAAKDRTRRIDGQVRGA